MIKVDGRWYWFDKEGYAVTGFQTIGGKDYYFAEKTWKNVKECQMVETDGEGVLL